MSFKKLPIHHWDNVEEDEFDIDVEEFAEPSCELTPPRHDIEQHKRRRYYPSSIPTLEIPNSTSNELMEEQLEVCTLEELVVEGD